MTCFLYSNKNSIYDVQISAEVAVGNTKSCSYIHDNEAFVFCVLGQNIEHSFKTLNIILTL